LAAINLSTVASLTDQLRQSVKHPIVADSTATSLQGKREQDAQSHQQKRLRSQATSSSEHFEFRYWAEQGWVPYNLESQRLLAAGWQETMVCGQPTVVSLPDPHDWIHQITLGLLAEDPDGNKEVIGFETLWPQSGQHDCQVRGWVSAAGFDNSQIPIGYMNLLTKCDNRPSKSPAGL
jgi:hypothetical protein